MASEIQAEAGRTPREEVCGILVGSFDEAGASVERLVPCRNVEPEERRPHRFSIDPRDVIEIERSLRGSGREVVGFYHSHPFSDAIPSRRDLTFMELWPDVHWLIAGRTAEEGGGGMRVWRWDEAAPTGAREVAVDQFDG